MLVSRKLKRAQSPGQNCSICRRTKVLKALKRRVFFHYANGLALAVLVCLSSFAVALAQKPTTPAADAKQPKKPSFVLTVKTLPILNISLKADKARVSE